MRFIYKYLTIFLVFGVIWFLIFSIPMGKRNPFFIVLQKQLKMYAEDSDDNSSKKEIDRQKVIDAITKAFESN